MTAIATPFASQRGQYAFMGDMALKNAFVELQGDGGKAKYVILPCAGSTLFSDVTDTPCRGAVFLPDLDLIYTVHSGSVYSVDSAGTKIRLGTIPGIDRVRIARNRKAAPQVVIQCDAGCYVVEGGVPSKITDADLPAVIDVTEMDGFIVYIVADGRFFLSSLNEATRINALDFAEAEQSADRNVAAWAFGGFLWLFGQKTIEPWKNTGNADFPFEPMPTTIPRGLRAKYSIAECDNALMFVGNDGIVYRLNGFQPIRISTHSVERTIQGDDSSDAIIGFSWSEGGHPFYAIAGDGWAWCYDASTQQWHERESYGQDVWRTNSAVEAWNKTIFGDRLTGNLYRTARDIYTEAGATFIWEIRTPTMQAFPHGGVVDALHIDTYTGSGITSPSAQGYDPKLMLSYSNDGGESYINERELKLGKQGNHAARVVARRLGRFGPQGRVWKMKISDPVGRGVALLDAQVRPLKR